MYSEPQVYVRSPQTVGTDTLQSLLPNELLLKKTDSFSFLRGFYHNTVIYFRTKILTLAASVLTILPFTSLRNEVT